MAANRSTTESNDRLDRRTRRIVWTSFLAIMLVVVAIFSVSNFGQSAPSKFSSVGSAIDGGGGSGGAAASALRGGGVAARPENGPAAAATAPTLATAVPRVADLKALDLPPAEAGRKVVSSGTVGLEVDDVVAMKSRARDAVQGAGGYLFGEKTTASGRATSTLTFKVPPENFERVLAELAALGPLTSVEVKTDDVTQQVVDLDARIRSSEASLSRVRDLVGRTNNLGELASLENEVQRRQTEYESLQGQLRTLADRTDAATIVVTLQTKPVTPVPVEAVATPPSSLPSFVDGIGVGWDALVAATTVVGAAIGVALPFAWLVLVPVAVVLVRGRRRRTALLIDG